MTTTSKARARVIAALAGILAKNDTVTRETFAVRMMEAESEHRWIVETIDRAGWHRMRLTLDVERAYRVLKGMPTGALWMHRRDY